MWDRDGTVVGVIQALNKVGPVADTSIGHATFEAEDEQVILLLADHVATAVNSLSSGEKTKGDLDHAHASLKALRSKLHGVTAHENRLARQSKQSRSLGECSTALHIQGPAGGGGGGSGGVSGGGGDAGSFFTLVVGRARMAVEAERATLWLVDTEKGEIYSRVAEGSDHEIRAKLGVGIAGMVASSGTVMNIPDAYKDAHFNHQVGGLMGADICFIRLFLNMFLTTGAAHTSTEW